MAKRDWCAVRKRLSMQRDNLDPGIVAAWKGAPVFNAYILDSKSNNDA